MHYKSLFLRSGKLRSRYDRNDIEAENGSFRSERNSITKSATSDDQRSIISIAESCLPSRLTTNLRLLLFHLCIIHEEEKNSFQRPAKLIYCDFFNQQTCHYYFAKKKNSFEIIYSL